MRTPFIAANWKMNKTTREVEEFFRVFQEKLGNYNRCDIAICVPFPYLGLASSLSPSGTHIHIGSQNIAQEESGAFTGETSATMVRDVGATAVVIGHSERRSLFHESSQDCSIKIQQAQKHGLLPILCIGETLSQRESQETTAVLQKQLRESLANIALTSGSQLVVAYEPVWAIGTGKTATPEDAESTIATVRAELAAIFDERIAQQTRILYGGSVKPSNIHALMEQPNIDGALVGGASLEADSFLQLVQFQEI